MHAIRRAREEVSTSDVSTAQGADRQQVLNLLEKESRTVRRLVLLLAAGTIWLFLLAGATLADNGPHVAGASSPVTDACASCHRAHSAQASYITIQAQPGLCYACHGAGTLGAETDVQDGAFYSSYATVHVSGGPGAGALRGGGIDYALISTGTYTGSFTSVVVGTSTPTATTSHHSVNETPQVMWGNGAYSSTLNYGKGSVDLGCASCHDPHGNHQYRILKPGPNDSGIANDQGHSPAALAAYNLGGRVYINDASSKVYTTTNFRNPDPGNTSAANLTGNASGDAYNGGPADGSLAAYNTVTNNWYGMFATISGQWCATCHTRYNALSGAYAVDSGDAVFRYQHAVYKLINPVTPGTGATPSTFTGTPTSATAAWITATTSDWSTSGTYGGTDTAVTGTLSTAKGTTTHAPMCLTCHVSHGTDSAMTSVITNQFSPGVNFATTGSAQVVGPTDASGDTNVNLGSTLLMLDNRGVCESCHTK